MPSDLDEVCHGLLQPEPAARYTCQDILDRLGVRNDALAAGSALEPDREAPFVGREAELELLRASFAASSDHCVVVALGGSAGIGKSRLVQRFLCSLQSEGQVVLAARCHERETLPYKIIDGLLDELIPFLKRLAQHELERILPRYVSELVRMFPALAGIEAFAAAERGSARSDGQEQTRAVTALSELFGRIADRYQLVLWIDDLQWGDCESVAVIRQVLCAADAPSCLCIGSFRSEAPDLMLLARRFLRVPRERGVDTDVRTLRLGRLSALESEALVHRSLREASADVVQHVAREADGSPFLAAQLTEFCLAMQGTGTPRPVSLHEWMATRLARLPPSAAEVVQLVALAATSVEQQVVIRAARLPDDTVFHQLRTARFVRTRGKSEAGRVELYQRALGAPTLSTLDATRARTLHARLAYALIEYNAGDRDHERIAFHLTEAGRDIEAVDYLLLSAERANHAFAHLRAARLYALALQTDAAGARAQAIRLAYADTLRKAGRGLEAAQAQVYLVAAASEPDEWRGFELRCKAAQQFLLMGHLEQGTALLHELMRRLRLVLPRSRWRALAGLLLCRAWLRLRGVGFRKRLEREVAQQDLARIDTCWLLGQALVMIDPLLGINLQSRHVLLALRSGEPSRIARALALEAACASFAGPKRQPRAERLLERARQLSLEVDDPLTRASATLWGAVVAYYMGEPERALREAKAVEPQLRDECTGTGYELATCHLIFLGAYYMQGAWLAFGQRAHQALDEAVARGNRYQSVGLRFHTNMARLLAGDAAGARREVQVVRDEWPEAEPLHMQHLAIFLGEARVRLYLGDGAGACEHLDRMWPQVQRSFLLRARFLLVDALAWRCRAHALAYTQSGAARHRRAVLRHCKQLDKLTFLGARGHAQVARGAVAAASGELERACELWRDAARTYDREQLRFCAEVARYQAARHTQGSFAQRLRAQAEQAIADAGVADVAAIAQLFSGVPAALAVERAVPSRQSVA